MRKFFFCIVGPSEWDGSAIHKGVEQIMMKKTLITALIATVFAGGAMAAAVTAEGTGVGKHGDVTVAVTFDGGKITDIKVVKEQENKVLARGVYTDLKDQVIATNSADLDVISGATFSSKLSLIHI